MWYRLLLLGILAFSLGVSYFVNQVRQKAPTILNHVIKIIFDTLSIISGTLIACQYLKVGRQQLGLVMILVSLLIVLQIIVEIVREPIKLNKFLLGILLIFPLFSSIYATSQFQAATSSHEKRTEKRAKRENYVKTTENQNLRVRQQINNQLALLTEVTKKYADFVLVGGTTTPGIYVYAENATDDSQVFLVKANNMGKFTAIVPQAKLKNAANLKIYVNGISILNDDTVNKEQHAVADENLNLQKISQEKNISDGFYHVGSDVKAGEYFLLSDGNGQISWSNGEQNSRSFDQSLYVKLAKDDLITIYNATLIPAVHNASFSSNEISNGMLKVGNDLAEGRYELKATADYAVAKIYDKPITSRLDEGQVLDSSSFELKRGQYVYLLNTKLIRK